jgi:hypothetical protein
MTKEKMEGLLASGETAWLDWKADFPTGLLAGKSSPDYDAGKGAVLKDLVSIANGTGEQYGYLVYGVKDKRTVRIVKGTSKSFDDANFQSWARNTFAPIPKFVYTELQWSPEQRIGVFTIERIPEYPHVVIRSVGGVLSDGQVWFRQGTQNGIAHRAELRNMILGETPWIASRTDDPELLRALAFYGEGSCGLAQFERKDSELARGYQVAHYPGTRREMWVSRLGRAELIALLKPRKDGV